MNEVIPVKPLTQYLAHKWCSGGAGDSPETPFKWSFSQFSGKFSLQFALQSSCDHDNVIFLAYVGNQGSGHVGPFWPQFLLP